MEKSQFSQGPIVYVIFVVSEGSFGGEHTAYYDLFRVENGVIAERWDVMETIMPETDWANENGKS